MHTRNIFKTLSYFGLFLAIHHPQSLYGDTSKSAQHVSLSAPTTTSKRKNNNLKYFIPIGVFGAATLILIPCVIYQKTNNQPVSSPTPPSKIVNNTTVGSSAEDVILPETLPKNMPEKISPELHLLSANEKEVTSLPTSPQLSPERSSSNLVKENPPSVKNAIQFDNHFLKNGDPLIIGDKDFSLEPTHPLKQYGIPGWVRENIKTDLTIPNEILGLLYKYCNPTEYIHVFQDDIAAFNKKGDIAFSRKSGKMYSIPYTPNNKPTCYKEIKSVELTNKYDAVYDMPYLSQQGDKIILDFQKLDKFILHQRNREEMPLRVVEAKTDTILYETYHHNAIFKADADLLLIQTEDKIQLWPLAQKTLISLPNAPKSTAITEPLKISLDRKTIACSFIDENEKGAIGVWHLGKGWQKGKNITYQKIKTTFSQFSNEERLCISPSGDIIINVDSTRRRLAGWQLNPKKNLYEEIFEHEVKEPHTFRNIELYVLDDEIYCNATWSCNFLSRSNISDKESIMPSGSYCGPLKEFAKADFTCPNNPLRGYYTELLGKKKHMLISDSSNNSILYTYRPEYESNKASNEQNQDSSQATTPSDGKIRLKGQKENESIHGITYYNKATIVARDKKSDNPSNRHSEVSFSKIMVLDDEFNYMRKLTIEGAWLYNNGVIKASKNYKYLAILEKKRDNNLTLYIYSFNEFLSKSKDSTDVKPLYSFNIIQSILEQISFEVGKIFLNDGYDFDIEAIEGNRFMVRLNRCIPKWVNPQTDKLEEVDSGDTSKDHISILVGLP